MGEKHKLYTKLDITNVWQYEALLELTKLLNKRFCISTAEILRKQVWYSYSDDFERCERCDESQINCIGHDDDPYDYDDRYSDEAEF